MILKTISASVMISFAAPAAWAQPAGVSIIPEPVQIQAGAGTFVLTPDVVIHVPPNNPEIKAIAERFSESLVPITGFPLRVQVPVGNPGGRSISLALATPAISSLQEEGYQLVSNQAGAKIVANKPAGLFYGLQTLEQMIPVGPEKNEKPTQGLEVPSLTIQDYPRFGWRGVMVDVSRHFLPKEYIKRHLDMMAKYKLNVFHWHLTDDPGWRIEIKAYPELTKTGAWRAKRTGNFMYFEPTRPGEIPTEGGFYTQQDIKEIVEYARQRFIMVVPEIDVPGHSGALNAAYPEASCSKIKHPVYPGGGGGAVFTSALCVSNEQTYEMLDKIFGEIAELFPGPYIHIGGDEVDTAEWRKCADCQKKIKDEGLKGEIALEHAFIKRVASMVNAKGKKVVGWDEIINADLSKDSVVMAWQGAAKGAAAAKAGHPVVMSPIEPYYLDHIQGEPAIERYGGYLLRPMRLNQVYAFDPLPEGVDPKLILGGQGNLWTERIASPRRAEYMTWPRALAIAEVLWSPKGKRNWKSFVNRVEAQFPRFDRRQISCARSIYDPFVVPSRDSSNQMQLDFSTEAEGLTTYYTFDYTFPDEFAERYEGKPIAIPDGATNVWAITYRDGKPIGRMLMVSLKNLEARLAGN